MWYLQKLPGRRAGVQSCHLRQGQPRPGHLCSPLRLSACTCTSWSPVQMPASPGQGAPACVCPRQTLACMSMAAMQVVIVRRCIKGLECPQSCGS